MTHVEAQLRAWFAHRTPVIKLLSFAILAGLGWALLPMIAFTNPSEAVFFGRYDRLYFGVLAGYTILVIGWGAFSIWLALRLDMDRLERWRGWAEQHARAIIGGLGVAFLLGWIVTAGIDWQIRAIPGEVQGRLRFVLPLSLSLLGLGIVIGWGDALQAGVKKSNSFQWMNKRREGLAAAALAILAGWLLLQRGLLTTALIKDASAHLYIGQQLLRGGIPYRTVIYFHPPLRFLISALWALPGAAGLPPVQSARIIYGLMTLGIIWAVFGVGEQLTGSLSGGIIAAGLLLHTPFITTTVFEGPNLKIAVALALTTSVWLAQRERWFWAGIVSAVGIGLWLPAVGGALGIGLTALLMKEARWRASRDTLLGGLLVGGLIVGWMTIAGTLTPFFRQSILAALTVAGNGEGGRLSALWQDMLNLPNLLNSWPLALLAGIGIVLVSVGRERGKRARSTWLAPVLVSLTLSLVMSQDVLLGLDFIALGGLLVGFAAISVVYVMNLSPAPAAGRQMAAGLVALSVVAMGIVTILSGKFDREPQPLTLADQQRMATELTEDLSPDDRVQSFDLMWFMVLTGRDNPLPVLQARPKGRVANAEAGWTEQAILDALVRTQPAVVMLEAGSQVDMSQLGEQYIYAGAFDVSTVRAQHVYIQQDRQDILQALGNWPTANP